MSEVVSKIRAYIFENFLFGADDSKLGNEDSFLETGVIDSTGILELVEWMEESFGIKVYDDDLVPENFDSVDRLAKYLTLKLAEAA